MTYTSTEGPRSEEPHSEEPCAEERRSGGSRSEGLRPFVLFDLDGTLVRPGSLLQRLHMSAMERAIREVSGSAEQFRYENGDLFYGPVDLSGFTDAGTIEAALLLAGTPRSAMAEALASTVDSMCRHLREEKRYDACAEGDALPGAAATVRRLASAGVPVGLSTGNARSVALWKAGRLGLGDILLTGGFGDTAPDRDLVVAQGAEAFGRPPAGGVVVGDTPKDVSAALSNGLRCVAVATGGTSEDELRRAGADAVLPGLDHPAAADVIAGVAAGREPLPL